LSDIFGALLTFQLIFTVSGNLINNNENDILLSNGILKLYPFGVVNVVVRPVLETLFTPLKI
jgi:hypothetical protein